MKPLHPYARLRTALPVSISLLVCAVLALPPAGAAEVTVLVANLRSAQGTVMLALFEGEARFLQPDGAVDDQRVEADRSLVSMTFRNVAPGRYAISVVHDENGNGKLDRNLVGIPTERFGFSNDAFGNAAPPAFAKAAFDVTVDTVLTINLR